MKNRIELMEHSLELAFNVLTYLFFVTMYNAFMYKMKNSKRNLVLF